MKVNLSASQVTELISTAILVVTTTAGTCAWFFNRFKREILEECKAHAEDCKTYSYILSSALQERIQGNETELNHLNNCAEKAWPRFQKLILSIRRRDIDEFR